MSKELPPLEALEALSSYQYFGNYKDFCKEIIETALKALEIIKEKKIDCLVLVLSKTYIEYNDICENEKSELSQEEYDLLKEVLL